MTFPPEIVRTLTPSDSKREMSSEYASPNASSTCVRDDRAGTENPLIEAVSRGKPLTGSIQVESMDTI